MKRLRARPPQPPVLVNQQQQPFPQESWTVALEATADQRRRRHLCPLRSRRACIRWRRPSSPTATDRDESEARVNMEKQKTLEEKEDVGME